MTNLLAHRVTGNPDGPPVLLLNGGMMTMGAWEPVAAPLSERFRVIRCDFRGQIFSPGEPEPSLDAHVADVIALLDSLEIPRAHVAGTSFGGFVALKLAADHPERVASLAIIAAAERITPDLWEGSSSSGPMRWPGSFAVFSKIDSESSCHDTPSSSPPASTSPRLQRSDRLLDDLLLRGLRRHFEI